MKRILPLILFCFSAFTFSAAAQTTITCNANFTWNSSGNSAKFLPDMVGDTPSVRHYWSFGDGHYSDATSPYNTYPAAGGTFTVIHYLIKKNPNGVELCRDSVIKQIVLQQDCVVPQFTYAADTTNYLAIKFTNTSYSINANDSISWMFGDGTHSGDINATHTYTTAGVYKVCLLIKKRGTTSNTTSCVREVCTEITIVKPCDLKVDFNWQKDPSLFNKVYFANATLPLNTSDSITWSFGDGTSSKDWNPAHVYSQAGTYTVCLKVKRKKIFSTDPECSQTFCKTIEIVAPACTVIPNFTWAANTTISTKINFTNATAGLALTDSVRWSFGDGTYSNEINPVHTFTQGGNYTVCLRIIKRNNDLLLTNCIKDTCKIIAVAPSCDFVPSFTWVKDSSNSYRIKFTNTTLAAVTNTNVLATWSFGDNSASVTGWNAVHEYAQPGKYYVCLKIQLSSACVKYKCDSITVTAPQPPCDFVTAFTWTKDATNSKKINFTNKTVLPTTGVSAVWSFGDGSANANSWNAVHEYTQPGKYYVCLRVEYGIGCVKYKCDSVTVPPPAINCSQLSSYTYQPASVNRLYYFMPTNQSSDVQYTWTFGDGMGSHDITSSHQFAEYGTYQVCLTAYKNTNCASTTCKEIKITPPVNCDTVKLSYSYRRDQYMSNKIYFYAISNVPVQQQTWTIFKRGTNNSITVNQNNPLYSFADTGYYYVCLKAVTNGGCIKEYCNAIQIDGISTRCELQAIPNPVTNQVNVTVQMDSPELIHAYIYNIQNILIQQKNQQGFAGNNVVSINTEGLVAGYYTIKLIYGNKVCFASSKNSKLGFWVS